MLQSKNVLMIFQTLSPTTAPKTYLFVRLIPTLRLDPPQACEDKEVGWTTDLLVYLLMPPPSLQQRQAPKGAIRAAVNTKGHRKVNSQVSGVARSDKFDESWLKGWVSVEYFWLYLIWTVSSSTDPLLPSTPGAFQTITAALNGAKAAEKTCF